MVLEKNFEAITLVYCLCSSHSTELSNFHIAGVKAPPRDYHIPGSGENKIWAIIGAIGNLFFAFNTGMIPEIQVCKYVHQLF